MSRKQKAHCQNCGKGTSSHRVKRYLCSNTCRDELKRKTKRRAYLKQRKR